MMPPMTWPQLGEISIEGISARYARELDPVLKKVTVYIKPGEKVRIQFVTAYVGMMPLLSWPQLGEISIEGISARYARELDPVLKKVTVYIKPGEKVRI